MNIIFDIGNVLLSFNPKEYIKSIVSEDRLEHIYQTIFKSDEWIMLDRGTITQDGVMRIIISRNAEYEEEIRKVFEIWHEMLVPIEESVEILRQLKALGHNIYYLSNFHELAFQHVYNKNEFFNLFDGGVVSFEEKFIKPEIDIYDLLIDKYKLNSKESIFIDDVQENIDSADKLGINTILFRNADDLITKLKAYDINL